MLVDRLRAGRQKARAISASRFEVALGIAREQPARGIEVRVVAQAGEDIEHRALHRAWRRARRSSPAAAADMRAQGRPVARFARSSPRR